MKPSLCAVITQLDGCMHETAASQADIFELRLDLIGPGWEDIVRSLDKPWIATNRLRTEGGKCTDDEEKRIDTLLAAVQAGAKAVDIELAAPGLARIVSLFKNRVELIISYHDFVRTPPLDVLQKIVKEQVKAGADICKTVTTANAFDDNITVMGLNKEFPGTRMVNFCMGEAGQISRILNPLFGGEFAYAALNTDNLVAPGQLTLSQLVSLYNQLSL